MIHTLIVLPSLLPMNRDRLNLRRLPDTGLVLTIPAGGESAGTALGLFHSGLSCSFLFFNHVVSALGS